MNFLFNFVTQSIFTIKLISASQLEGVHSYKFILKSSSLALKE